MSECTSCGAKIDYRDKFCSSCGTLTVAGRPIAHQIGKAVTDAATELSRLAQQLAGYVRDESNRKQVIIGGSTFVLLLVVLTDNPISNGVSSLFGSEPEAPRFTADGLPDFANYEDAYLSEGAEYLLTGNANVRNYPTSQNTQVVKTLASGTRISARQVKAFDPTAQWYRLADGGYVWGGNLARPDGQSVGGAMFPSYLRGQWSMMDTCRGADIDDFHLDISATEMRFYESGGSLVRTSADYKQRELYHVAMSGEGSSWDEVFRFMLSEDSMALTVFGDDGFTPMATYYNPGVNCSRVRSDDKLLGR